MNLVCYVGVNQEILFYFKITKEDNDMGKRVGSFINPATGEEDWLEPETISMVVLQPKMITKVGEVNQSAIDFKLDATKDEENIMLIAEYSSNGARHSSAPVLMPAETFADKFKDIIYSDKSLDESDIVKAAKETACQDLTRKLLDNNVLMGGMSFAGFGFVTVDNDKVLTIESIDFDYRIENEKGVCSATIRGCVGQASLQNLENPVIKLWNNTHRVELVKPVVTEAIEGRTKDYVLKIDSISVTPDTSMPEHATYEKPDFKNEDFLDKFISERKSLLDDISGDDSDLDDRFSDIF